MAYDKSRRGIQPSDWGATLGEDMEGWEGERWVDVRSAAVRRIMVKRLKYCKSIGCDGVDPGEAPAACAWLRSGTQAWLGLPSAPLHACVHARCRRRAAADFGRRRAAPPPPVPPAPAGADNVNGHENDSGFALTQSDLIKFNTFLANTSHRLGMGIGLKNGLDMVGALHRHFDW